MEYQESNCCSGCGYYYDIEEDDMCYECKTINEDEYRDFADQLRKMIKMNQLNQDNMIKGRTK
jgi:hypothetical protein